MQKAPLVLFFCCKLAFIYLILCDVMLSFVFCNDVLSFVFYVHWFLKEGFVHIKGREQVCDGTFDFQILHRRSHVRRAAKYKTTNYKAPMCTHSCARLGSFHIRIAELQNTVDKFKISTGYLIETNYRAATIRTSIHGFSLLYVCPRFDNSSVHCVIRRTVNHWTFY